MTQQRLRETESREKAANMENTVAQIVAAEKETTEKKVRQELANELKKMIELKRDNEMLKVGGAQLGSNYQTQ
jgi:predicted esterase YcpF (UPF0227 family)